MKPEVRLFVSENQCIVFNKVEEIDDLIKTLNDCRDDLKQQYEKMSEKLRRKRNRRRKRRQTDNPAVNELLKAIEEYEMTKKKIQTDENSALLFKPIIEYLDVLIKDVKDSVYEQQK